jgi:hypothetical protein
MGLEVEVKGVGVSDDLVDNKTCRLCIAESDSDISGYADTVGSDKSKLPGFQTCRCRRGSQRRNASSVSWRK